MSRSDGGPCPGSSLPGGRGCHVTSGASFPPSTTSDFSRGRWAVLGTLCSVPTEVVRAPSTYVLAQSQGHPPPGAGAAVGAEEIDQNLTFPKFRQRLRFDISVALVSFLLSKKSQIIQYLLSTHHVAGMSWKLRV